MPTLPALPGVAFREAAPDRDAASICALISACADVDRIEQCSTLESVPTIDQTRSTLVDAGPGNTIVAEIDGRVVGYNTVIWWQEPGNVWLFLHIGRVEPTARGQGIGTALLEWSEARIRELAPAVAAGGIALYGANASSTEVSATQLSRDHGYEAVFTLAQMRYGDITRVRAHHVEGIDIRPPVHADIDAINTAQLEAWAHGAFGQPIEDDASRRKEFEDAFDSHVTDNWRIAWDGATVAGQVWCSIHEHGGVKYGVFDEVNTSPAYRRRGIAQALITHMLAEFASQGCTEARLHTDTGNRMGARSLYEKLGFATVKTFPRYRKSILDAS